MKNIKKLELKCYCGDPRCAKLLAILYNNGALRLNLTSELGKDKNAEQDILLSKEQVKKLLGLLNS